VIWKRRKETGTWDLIRSVVGGGVKGGDTVIKIGLHRTKTTFQSLFGSTASISETCVVRASHITCNVRQTLLRASQITCTTRHTLLHMSRITCNARRTLVCVSRIICNTRCALLRASRIICNMRHTLICASLIIISYLTFLCSA
jgi:hypothetical protein